MEPVAKGAPAFVEEALACVQTLQSRRRTPACANCLCPLAPLPPGLPALPNAPPPPPAAPHPCRNARCPERFCSAACSAAACASWHGVLCAGGPLASQPHHPLREFTAHASRSNEVFLLAARAVASAIASARAAPGGLSPASSEAAAAPLLALPWDGRPFWEVLPEGARRRLSEAKHHQAAESHQLLAAGIAHSLRVSPAACAPLLDFAFFARVCAALQARLQHVALPHPAAAFCAALVAAPREAQRAALEALRPAVEAAAAAADAAEAGKAGRGGAGAAAGEKRKRPAAAEGSGDDESDDEDDDDEESDDEESDDDEEDEESSESGDDKGAAAAAAAGGGGQAQVRPPSANPRGSGIRWDDAPERVAAAVAELAPRAFPPVAGVAVGGRCAALAPSCAPDLAVEALPRGGAASAQHPGAHAFPPGSRCLLSAVALRDLPAGPSGAGEGTLTAAYVTASDPPAERRAARAARGLPAECGCALCRLQARWRSDEGGMGPAEAEARAAAAAADAAGISSADLHWVAKVAFQGEGRYAEAEAVLRALCARDAGDGEALHGVGVCLLAAGRWREAHAWWAEAALAAPAHPALAAIAEKDASYWPSPRAPVLPPPPPAPAPGQQPPPPPRLEPIPRGEVAAVARFWSAEACAAAVASAEAHAASRGGWTTARHYAVPTTDIPLQRLTDLLPAFNAAVRDRVRPALWAAFPETRGRRPRVHDAFLVRYHAAEQRHLPVHADESEFSLTVALNARGEFDGGGTFFEGDDGGEGGKTVVPEVGEMVVFRGGTVRHGGEPVTRGVRYILAVFMFLDDEKQE